jgi:hypothetical protein
MITFFQAIEIFSSSSIFCKTYTPPCAVALSLHNDHQILSGFQVKLHGVFTQASLEYSSIIQAII